MGYDEGVGRGTITAGFQSWIAARTGGQLKVAFWVHVLSAAFPDKQEPDPRTFSTEEHDQAVDALFAMLLAYLDEGRTQGLAGQ